ncbi:unnamed protein product, partial [Symbiodinium pilosum]
YDAPPAPNQPSRQFRVTHTRVTDKAGNARWGAPVAVMKNKRAVLDLYAGRSIPTSGPRFDLRVALSTEAPVHTGTMPTPASHQ